MTMRHGDRQLHDGQREGPAVAPGPCTGGISEATIPVDPDFFSRSDTWITSHVGRYDGHQRNAGRDYERYPLGGAESGVRRYKLQHLVSIRRAFSNLQWEHRLLHLRISPWLRVGLLQSSFRFTPFAPFHRVLALRGCARCCF